MPNGYLIGTAIFGMLLVMLVVAQIMARRFNPWLYWATIIASTTCGTTLADFADRSLGIGYPGGSLPRRVASFCPFLLGIGRWGPWT